MITIILLLLLLLSFLLLDAHIMYSVEETKHELTLVVKLFKCFIIIGFCCCCGLY